MLAHDSRLVFALIGGVLDAKVPVLDDSESGTSIPLTEYRDSVDCQRFETDG
jgi:hypothetical protein